MVAKPNVLSINNVCMYIYMFIYRYIHTHIYMCIYLYIHIYTYIIVTQYIWFSNRVRWGNLQYEILLILNLLTLDEVTFCNIRPMLKFLNTIKPSTWDNRMSIYYESSSAGLPGSSGKTNVDTRWTAKTSMPNRRARTVLLRFVMISGSIGSPIALIILLWHWELI